MQYMQVKDVDGNVMSNQIKRIDANGNISWIPNDPANNDWVIYQAWLADGNTPDAAP